MCLCYIFNFEVLKKRNLLKKDVAVLNLITIITMITKIIIIAVIMLFLLVIYCLSMLIIKCYYYY